MITPRRGLERGLRVVAALAAVAGGVADASGQEVAKPGTRHDAGASNGVIKPPPGVDPGITARVPPTARFPTPVNTPPNAPEGGTPRPKG